ncbi:hypothetical protein PybrP1_011418 [[Pythium] brassicae (nom. inval.)]|nr:hypothetical protein PybrP1_011418 [[Pythium] brassicae (nom. inval.)]
MLPQRSPPPMTSTAHFQRPKGFSAPPPLMAVEAYSSRVLGVAGVVAIVFLFGCGGPADSGEIVTAGGPLVGLIAIAVYPLVMTVPYGYIVAELSSAFPQDGGFTIWVMHAFGAFWALQVGTWSWVIGVLSCAIVPGLALNVFLYCFKHTLASDVEEYLIKLAVAVVLTLPALGGTKITARVCVALTALVLLPFVVFSVWTFARASAAGDASQVRREAAANVTAELAPPGDDGRHAYAASDFQPGGDVGILWGLLINALSWKYGGLHMASLFGGEVKDPARVFPRAVALAIALSFLTILLPTTAAILAHIVPWPKFAHPAVFITVGETVGGRFLYVLVLVSSVATIVGRYVASIYCTSFQVSGMAEHELLPAFLANKNNRFRTPQCAVLCTFAAVLPLLTLSSKNLLRVTNAFSCAVELLVLLAAVKLRRAMPYVARPVKMPGGLLGLVLATLIPAFVLCYVLYDIFSGSDMWYIGLCLGLPGIVYGLYNAWGLRARADQRSDIDPSSSGVITPDR